MNLEELRLLMNPAPNTIADVNGTTRPAVDSASFSRDEASEYSAAPRLRLRGELQIDPVLLPAGRRVSRKEAELDPSDVGLIRPSSPFDERDGHDIGHGEDDDISNDVDNDDTKGSVGTSDAEESNDDDDECPDHESHSSTDEEEEATVARLRAAEESEILQAAALKRQRDIVDSVINMRIRLEPIVEISRRFGSLAESENAENPDLSRGSLAERLRRLASSLDSTAHNVVRRSRLDTDDVGSGDDEGRLPEKEFSPKIVHSWCLDILDDWAQKMQAMPGTTGNRKTSVSFKAIDNRPSTQVRTVLGAGKHLEKSRKVRGRLELWSNGNESEYLEGSNVRHFDDGDLYRALLREVIESGGAPGGGLQYAQLARSGRVRKKIDRRASKGRKLRYTTHEKLVGFLAPAPMPDPGPVDEILAALFGGGNA